MTDGSGEKTLADQVEAITTRPSSVWVWRFMHALLRLTALPYFRVRVVGQEQLSLPGPVVIAPTHRSNLDVPILGSLSRRRFRYLSKRSMFKGGVMTWFLAANGAFPVERGAADREALDLARRQLESGHALLVFPEGTRRSGHEVGELYEGVVFLAAHVGAPIVPVAVHGTEAALPSGSKFPRRTRVQVVVGEPIELEAEGGRMKRSARRSATDDLRGRLQMLYDEARARG